MAPLPVNWFDFNFLFFILFYFDFIVWSFCVFVCLKISVFVWLLFIFVCVHVIVDSLFSFAFPLKKYTISFEKKKKKILFNFHFHLQSFFYKLFSFYNFFYILQFQNNLHFTSTSYSICCHTTVPSHRPLPSTSLFHWSPPLSFL